MALVLRASIFLYLLLHSNIQACRGDGVIRSKPEAPPDESQFPNEECTSQTICSTTPDLSLWLKQNKLDHFIPKLQNLNLDTLITAYELDPKILLLIIRCNSSIGKGGKSLLAVPPFLLFLLPRPLFCVPPFLFCVPPFTCSRRTLTPLCTLLLFVWPVRRKQLRENNNMDLLEASQLIAALQHLSRRKKRRVRISHVEDMYFGNLQHEIDKSKSLKELLPSLRLGKYVRPPTHIVSCIVRSTPTQQTVPFFSCFFLSF